MDSGYRGNGNYELSNFAGEIRAAPGELVFVALRVRERGAVISECTQLLMAAAPLPSIMEAISDLTGRSRRTP